MLERRSDRFVTCTSRDLALVRDALQGVGPAREEVGRRLQKVHMMVEARARSTGAPLQGHDCEDIAQQSTLTALNRLHTFEGRARLETWLYRICVFELLSHLRRTRRRDQLLARWIRENLAEFEARFAPSATLPPDLRRLERALDELGPPRADVVRLRNLEGLTFPEIARRTGTLENTVRSHYHRGVRWLRRRLAATDDGVEPP